MRLSIFSFYPRVFANRFALELQKYHIGFSLGKIKIKIFITGFLYFHRNVTDN